MSRRTEPHRVRPRRRFLRALLWTVLVLCLVLGSGLAYLWHSPIRAEWIHQKVVARLKQATGMDIAYDSALLDLPRRTYEFRNLRFSDPKQPGTELLRLGSLLLRVRPLAILTGSEAIVRDMD